MKIFLLFFSLLNCALSFAQGGGDKVGNGPAEPFYLHNLIEVTQECFSTDVGASQRINEVCSYLFESPSSGPANVQNLLLVQGGFIRLPYQLQTKLYQCCIQAIQD